MSISFRVGKILTTLLVVFEAVACGSSGQSQATVETLNVYNWANSIAPDTVANFERETGIKVHYSTFESDEALETKLLTGHSNYDIVVPSDVFFEREVRAGVFQKLDKAALPNARNLDPIIMRELASRDPGNLYGAPYLWGTTGIGYNVDKVRERLGAAELDSWSLLFDPKNAEKLQDCGILIVDSPTDALPSALLYLGKNPSSRDPRDLNEAADVLMKIRPYVRSIEAVGLIDALSNGSMCLILSYSGDVTQAKQRAIEATNGVKIRYFVPREGTLMSIEVMGIPADAPHPKNALKWLNYLMRPEVMANITNAVKWPNGNEASLSFVQDTIKNDPALYPDAATQSKLHPLPILTPEQARLVTRLWTRFRTGQ